MPDGVNLGTESLTFDARFDRSWSKTAAKPSPNDFKGSLSRSPAISDVLSAAGTRSERSNRGSMNASTWSAGQFQSRQSLLVSVSTLFGDAHSDALNAKSDTPEPQSAGSVRSVLDLMSLSYGISAPFPIAASACRLLA